MLVREEMRRYKNVQDFRAIKNSGGTDMTIERHRPFHSSGTVDRILGVD